MEAAVGVEALARLQLASWPLSLLVYAELKLVLLLLLQLLGYLLLLLTLSQKALVLLVGLDGMHRALIVHTHEPAGHELLHLALEVDLVLQSFLEPLVLRHHLSPLGQELLYLNSLSLLLGLVIQDLLPASATFR